MNKAISILVLVVIIVAIGIALGYKGPQQSVSDRASSEASTQQTDTVTTVNIQETMNVTLTTNKGPITLELYADKTPKTVENFTKLAAEGFYDGTKFHRIIPDFMIQGGDPLTKDDSQQAMWGTGGPGYQFEDEIVPELSNVTGTISMANAGPNTNGSQFFINVADNTFLDGKHAVFGKVVEGMDLVMELSNTETGPRDVPVSPIVIESVTIAQ